MRMTILRLALVTSFSVLPSCTSRAPFAVLTVEDQGNIAACFASVQIGNSREALESIAVAKTSFPPGGAGSHPRVPRGTEYA